MEVKNDAKTFRTEILYQILYDINSIIFLGEDKSKHNIICEDLITNIKDIAIKLFYPEFRNQSLKIYDLYINAFMSALRKIDDDFFNVDMMSMSESIYFLLDIDPLYGLNNLIESERIKSEDIKTYPQNKNSKMYRFFECYLAIINEKIYSTHDLLKRSILSGKIPYKKDNDVYYLNPMDVCQWAKEKNYITSNGFNLDTFKSTDKNEQAASASSSARQEEVQLQLDSRVFINIPPSLWAGKTLPVARSTLADEGYEPCVIAVILGKLSNNKTECGRTLAQDQLTQGVEHDPKTYQNKFKNLLEEANSKYLFTFNDQ